MTEILTDFHKIAELNKEAGTTGPAGTTRGAGTAGPAGTTRRAGITGPARTTRGAGTTGTGASNRSSSSKFFSLHFKILLIYFIHKIEIYCVPRSIIFKRLKDSNRSITGTTIMHKTARNAELKGC